MAIKFGYNSYEILCDSCGETIDWFASREEAEIFLNNYKSEYDDDGELRCDSCRKYWRSKRANKTRIILHKNKKQLNEEPKDLSVHEKISGSKISYYEDRIEISAYYDKYEQFKETVYFYEEMGFKVLSSTFSYLTKTHRAIISLADFDSSKMVKLLDKTKGINDQLFKENQQKDNYCKQLLDELKQRKDSFLKLRQDYTTLKKEINHKNECYTNLKQNYETLENDASHKNEYYIKLKQNYEALKNEASHRNECYTKLKQDYEILGKKYSDTERQRKLDRIKIIIEIIIFGILLL